MAQVPTRVHAKYQLYNLGWHVDKYILRRNPAPLRPLYRKDDEDDIDDGPLTIGPDGKPLTQQQMTAADEAWKERQSGFADQV